MPTLRLLPPTPSPCTSKLDESGDGVSRRQCFRSCGLHRECFECAVALHQISIIKLIFVNLVPYHRSCDVRQISEPSSGAESIAKPNPARSLPLSFSAPFYSCLSRPPSPSLQLSVPLYPFLMLARGACSLRYCSGTMPHIPLPPLPSLPSHIAPGRPLLEKNTKDLVTIFRSWSPSSPAATAGGTGPTEEICRSE